MNEKQIWSFKDTPVLRSLRGVVVDNHSCVFVAGEKSGNIVLISSDRNSLKEALHISSTRAMCYDSNENEILVCQSDNKHPGSKYM